MNEESVGLIIFALIALGAVFAFILVFGGPPADTGYVSGAQKPAVSWFKIRDAYDACNHGSMCEDGLPAIPTGNFDELHELFECRCQTSNPSFLFYRSAYSWG